MQEMIGKALSRKNLFHIGGLDDCGSNCAASKNSGRATRGGPVATVPDRMRPRQRKCAGTARYLRPCIKGQKTSFRDAGAIAPARNGRKTGVSLCNDRWVLTDENDPLL
jgi:hypothetical protein